MVFFIRRREHFAFVDHVGAYSVKYLCFVGMANSALGHDWDCYCVHYILNYLDTCSPCYSACLPTSYGSLSRTITATAPASSAITACSTFVTSITTPCFCMWAKPRFNKVVPRTIRAFSIVSTLMPLGFGSVATRDIVITYYNLNCLKCSIYFLSDVLSKDRLRH